MKKVGKTCYVRYKKDFYLAVTLTPVGGVMVNYQAVRCFNDGDVRYYPLDERRLFRTELNAALSFIFDYPDGEVAAVDFNEPRLRILRSLFPSMNDCQDGTDWSDDIIRHNWMWQKGIQYEKLKEREKAVMAINQDGTAVSYLKWAEVARNGIGGAELFLSQAEYNKIVRFGQDIRGYYNTLFESGF